MKYQASRGIDFEGTVRTASSSSVVFCKDAHLLQRWPQCHLESQGIVSGTQKANALFQQPSSSTQTLVIGFGLK